MSRFFSSTLLALSLAACAPAGDDNQAADDRVEPTASAARIVGDAPGPGEITVMRRDAGTFAFAGSGEADASGHYEIEVDAALDVHNDYIVSFEGDDGSTREVIVSGEVRLDATLHAADSDDETSAEAAVYAEIVAAGGGDGEDDAFFTQLLVDANVTAMLSDDADGSETEDAAEVVASTTAALELAIDAASSGSIEAAEEAMAETEAEEATDGAYDGSISASASLSVLLASSESDDADRGELLIGLNAALEAMRQGDEDGDASSVEAMIAAELTAERNDRATSIVAEAMGALSLGGASDSADESLAEEVDGLVDDLLGSGDSEGSVALGLAAALDLAWSDYEGSILTELAVGLTVDQDADAAEALQIALALRAEADGEIGRASAEGDAEATGTAAYDAFDSFYAEATAEVTASLLTSGSFDEDEAHAMASLLVELAASGGDAE